MQTTLSTQVLTRALFWASALLCVCHAPQALADPTPQAAPGSARLEALPTQAQVLGQPSAGHLMVRGKDQLGLGKARVALGLFQQAHEVGYDRPDLHYYLAEAHRALGDAQAALEAYHRFVELVPSPSSTLGLAARQQISTLTAEAEGAPGRAGGPAPPSAPAPAPGPTTP